MRRSLWIVLLIADLVLLSAFLLGYSARWIDPRIVWWPQLWAIVLPFTSLLLLLSTFFVAYRRKWLLLTLHGFCLVLVFFRFFSPTTSFTSQAPSGSGLRIMSYNLGQLETLNQTDLAAMLSETLRIVGPDIFCMQEFLVRYRGNPLRFNNLPYVARAFDSLGYQIVAQDKHEVSNSLKPVLTRGLLMKSKERLVLEEKGFPEMSVIRVVFEWQGKEAVLYNLHLRTFGERKPWSDNNLNPLNPAFWSFYVNQYRQAFLYRAWQADKVRALIDAETLPLLVVGDFNSTPHNWVFHRIAASLRDVYAETGAKRKSSYHSRFPFTRIDHVLVSEEWDVIKSDILPFKHSDHRPLFVTLQWK